MKVNADSARASGKPHAVVRGVEEALREIAGWEGVESVVAGRISKVKHHYPRLSVTVQTATVSGVKCFARLGQAVQELFVVTSQPEAVAEHVRRRWTDEPGA
ncbi:MAG: DUF2103 domain-containing protein [Chloroflexota bacterium]